MGRSTYCFGARVAFGVLAAIVLVARPMVPVRAQTPTAPQAVAGEVRGLWVQSTTLTSAKSIQQMVDTARRAGFNTLLVDVRSRGEAFYDSRVEPRANVLDEAATGFDPLALTLTAAHSAGLKVHAWFTVGLVSSAVALPRSREHVAARHPEWLMVPRRAANMLRAMPPDMPIYVGEIARAARATAATVDGIYQSPVAAASRDYTVRVVTDLVSRYAVDGLHLDALRYPTDDFDYSAQTLGAFRAEMAPTVPADMRDRFDRLAKSEVAAWADGLPEAWSRFRQAKLTTLLSALRSAATKARPGLFISASVSPDADEARTQRLQDWRAWTAHSLLDAVCPMVDSTDATVLSTSLAAAKRDASTVPVWAGIGAYKLSVERAAEHVKSARRVGVGGILLFSYDSLAAIDGPADFFTLIRPALLDESSLERRR